MESFGVSIRKLREQSKKSMRDLAKALGVSIAYISDIELGHRNPPRGEKLDKMAEFLGIDQGDIAWLAAKEKGYVKIEIQGRETPMTKVALALVRHGNNLTREQADQILTVLRRVG